MGLLKLPHPVRESATTNPQYDPDYQNEGVTCAAWRTRSDMVKRAVDIKVVAEPAEPKPGDKLQVTLTLINAGAGHKLPTGDPDRHFTVEFAVEDQNRQVLESQTDTMGRWIMWQPAIVELHDNRLMPLANGITHFPIDYRKTLRGSN